MKYIPKVRKGHLQHRLGPR